MSRSGTSTNRYAVSARTIDWTDRIPGNPTSAKIKKNSKTPGKIRPAGIRDFPFNRVLIRHRYISITKVF